MHFYPFNIGDYVSHTRHLNLIEDLAYRRLLDLYYLQEQPLNESPTTVARLINMRDHVDEVSVVMQEFFDLIDGVGWVNSRADEEIAKSRKFAVEGFAESLLPVIDSLEAGLALPNATIEQIREGSEATLRQLKSALERNKVVEVNPSAGTKFDPSQHQAISMVPADQEANTVVSVLQKGYLIAERVLRPALVTVAAPK